MTYFCGLSQTAEQKRYPGDRVMDELDNQPKGSTSSEVKGTNVESGSATEPVGGHVFPSPAILPPTKEPPPSQELVDYGYEEFENPVASSGRSNRTVQRRNVVKVDEAVHAVSYHPGRVVRSMYDS